ncbi:MAG: class I SAM-dependent methyltransferase [Bacillota bacterium]
MSWYARLGTTKGKYFYPWSSTISEPNGETIFTKEVAAMVVGKKVLDVGCGHGEYAMSWNPVAKEVVGLDAIDTFLPRAMADKPANISFVVANTRNGLPFAAGEFDCAYTRRGPGSAYADLKRVVKPGGMILGLHPGDGCNSELANHFPVLYDPPASGQPIMDSISAYLHQGGLGDAEIEVITSIEYLHSPEDILRMRCHGQTPALYDYLAAECLAAVTEIFEQHATPLGFPTTFVRYLVRANA